MKMKNNAVKTCCKRGFTLIELLVVVLIIGILAAVALPQYNKAVKKAQGTELLNAVDAMDTALSSWYLTHGEYVDRSKDYIYILHHDSFDIDLPVLKYWKYDNLGGGTGQTSGSFIQIGCSNVSKIPAQFYSNPAGLVVRADWDSGKLVEMECNEESGNHGRKCSDVLTCEFRDVPTFACDSHCCGTGCGTPKKTCFIRR